MDSRSRVVLIVLVTAGIGAAASFAIMAGSGSGAAQSGSTPAAPQNPPATLPVTQAATGPAIAPAPAGDLRGDWPAFHGGGDMRGVTGPLPAKPRPFGLRWTFKLEEDPAPILASAAIVGPFTYVGDTRGRFFCLNLADGKPKWTYTVKSGWEASPLVVGGRVYVGDMDGIFHCISAETGQKIWTFDVESGQPIHAGANILGDRIVFGDDAGNIVCVTTDGKKAWQVQAGDRINSAPAIGNGMAYVSGCDAQLRGISIADGKQKFEMELPSLAAGSPALVGDRLLIGTDGGRLACIAADGSKTIWTYEGFKEQAMVYGSPAVSGDIVVVGARDERVHAVNLKTGEKIWTFGTRGNVDSSPAIAGGSVYIASEDKKLYVLDLKSGTKRGEFQAQYAIEASPAIGQGVVVVSDGRGNVYCLE
jgi:outer membrane protein assembly factor BamB